MNQGNENFGFCTACSAKLTGTAFCGNCGTKVAEKPVEAVAPVEEVAPVGEVASVGAGRKFPIASVILIGVAVLMALISLIGRFTFLKFMEFSCLAAVITGMIVMKKDKNLLVGLGFICLALSVMIFNIRNMSLNLSMGAPVGVMICVLIIQAVTWLADVGVGITYLVGKPKLAGLKIAACAVAMGIGFFMMICSLVAMRGNGAGSLIFTFLLENVTVFVGAILYTPFKK